MVAKPAITVEHEGPPAPDRQIAEAGGAHIDLDVNRVLVNDDDLAGVGRCLPARTAPRQGHMVRGHHEVPNGPFPPERQSTSMFGKE